MRLSIASALPVLAILLAGAAFAQVPPSTGAESSTVQACFYECKPGPLVQEQRTYREITTLMVTNNGRFPTTARVFFLDGRENVRAKTSLDLSPLDVDELQVCATIERITGAAPPEAGLIQITDPVALAQQEPSGVFAFIKNLGGKFFAQNPEPFDGRVVGVGKTQCKLIAVPEVNDPDFIESLAANAPEGDAVLVENTDDPEAGLPDLLPIPTVGGFYCRLNPTTGDLQVEVRNQGPVGAGASATRVDFPGFGATTQGTPALGPGVSTILNFPIPLGCYNPDCDFTISVDDGGAVPESNEGNNVASDFCLG
jgi:hypothetical protein